MACKTTYIATATYRVTRPKSYRAIGLARHYSSFWAPWSLAEAHLRQTRRKLALFGELPRRPSSTMPSTLAPMSEVVGQSGRTYRIKDTLQDKEFYLGRVYLASDGDTQVVLKEIPQNWNYRNEIYEIIKSCPHIRLPIDVVPERRMFVFKYLQHHLLNLAQSNLPLSKIKYVLKATLKGIASLHDLRVSHNDIKANNILVQTNESPSGVEIAKVEIMDLEDSIQLQPNEVVKGMTLGNFMWRSPEAHAEGPMEMPSDIFAFGIVCIYAVTKFLIFAVQNPNLTEDDKLGSVYFKQLSYFADEDGTAGLLEYIGKDNPVREIFEAVEEAFKDVPKDPFKDWDMPELDDDFKDLVGRMTKLDPRKRITAREALAHKWFQDV